MKAPAKSPRPAKVKPDAIGHSRKKRDTPENPLWVINIAMATFFIVTALVLMIS
jgi:hypothetical protein